jgi:hypothetical protein
MGCEPALSDPPDLQPAGPVVFVEVGGPALRDISERLLTEQIACRLTPLLSVVVAARFAACGDQVSAWSWRIAVDPGAAV